MMSRWCFSAWVSLLLAMSAAGCTGAPQLRTAPPQAADSPSSLESSDDTRGIYVDVAQRLGFEHTLKVRRSENGAPHDLQDGDTAMTGDRIHLSILTSSDAYLYLAFCAHRALAIYPQHGIRTRAGDLMSAPDRDLVLDDIPGPEVIYVILSRRELSIADPKLAAAIAAQRPSGMTTDCGPSFEATLVGNPAPSTGKPTPSTTQVLRGERLRKKPRNAMRPDLRASGGNHPPNPKAAPLLIANPPPDPDFERNPGIIVWYGHDGATGPSEVVAADDDGIAVVRHAFVHVSRR
jgi:hypothetical protein